MKKSFLWVTCILLSFSVTIISWKAEKIKKNRHLNLVKTRAISAKGLFGQYLDDIYNTAQLHAAGLDFEVFQKAVTGYFNLKSQNQVPQTSSIITIVDLAKSSSTKRMWIIDLIDKNLLINTWTVNELPDMQSMIDLGLDMIITNYPAQLRELTDELVSS